MRTVGDKHTSLGTGAISNANHIRLRVKIIDDDPVVSRLFRGRTEKTDNSWISMMYWGHRAAISALLRLEAHLKRCVIILAPLLTAFVATSSVVSPLVSRPCEAKAHLWPIDMVTPMSTSSGMHAITPSTSGAIVMSLTPGCWSASEP